MNLKKRTRTLLFVGAAVVVTLAYQFSKQQSESSSSIQPPNGIVEVPGNTSVETSDKVVVEQSSLDEADPESKAETTHFEIDIASQTEPGIESEVYRPATDSIDDSVLDTIAKLNTESVPVIESLLAESQLSTEKVTDRQQTSMANESDSKTLQEQMPSEHSLSEGSLSESSVSESSVSESAALAHSAKVPGAQIVENDASIQLDESQTRHADEPLVADANGGSDASLNINRGAAEDAETQHTQTQSNQTQNTQIQNSQPDETPVEAQKPDGQLEYLAGLRTYTFRDLERADGRQFEIDVSKVFFGVNFNQPLSEGWILDGQIRANYEYRNGWSGNQQSQGPFLEVKKLRIIGESLFDSPWWSMELGRKRLSSQRGWLYDDEMDFLAVQYESTLLDMEVGFATWLWDGLLGKSPSQFNDEQTLEASGADYLFFKAQYQWQKGHFLQLDFLSEDFDNPRDLPSGEILRNNLLVRQSDAQWLSLSAYGTERKQDIVNRYWLDTAYTRGQRREVLTQNGLAQTQADIDISGEWALQFGLLRQYQTDGWGIGITGAWSDATANRQDGEYYFQPVIAQNRTNLFSNVKRRYFGELLAPGLENLRGLSVHGGYEISPDLWLEASVHRYWQAQPDRAQFLSRTSVPVNGQQKQIGSSAELMLSGEIDPKTNMELLFAVMWPENGYESTAKNEPAWRVQFQIQRRW